MKTFKRIFAVILALVLSTSSFVCFAADDSKQYHNYEKVLLLGDSQASGYSDYRDVYSEFCYVEESYAAYLAKDLGAELLPFACPGFRTIELRYMLDDTYAGDDRLFNAVPSLPREAFEASKPYIRQAIKDADLITIGIGGNDWGAYLTWIMASVQLENKLPEEFRNELKKFLKNASFDDNIIEKLVEIADYCNALDELATALPEAMSYGVRNMRTNWNYIVEYIYENNPDVTLMVIGMFAGDYKTTKDAPDIIIESDPITSAIENYIVDFRNEHVLDNQEKYGYIFVDTSGTIVEESHPTVAGHRFIADRILEELPDARFDLTDIKAGQTNYKAVEYMYLNGLMNATADKTFNGNAKITKAEFAALLSNYNTVYPVSVSDKSVTLLEVKIAAFITAENKTIKDLFNLISYFTKSFLTGDAFAPATRMQVASEFYSYIR